MAFNIINFGSIPSTPYIQPLCHVHHAAPQRRKQQHVGVMGAQGAVTFCWWWPGDLKPYPGWWHKLLVSSKRQETLGVSSDILDFILPFWGGFILFSILPFHLDPILHTAVCRGLCCLLGSPCQLSAPLPVRQLLCRAGLHLSNCPLLGTFN